MGALGERSAIFIWLCHHDHVRTKEDAILMPQDEPPIFLGIFGESAKSCFQLPDVTKADIRVQMWIPVHQIIKLVDLDTRQAKMRTDDWQIRKPRKNPLKLYPITLEVYVKQDWDPPLEA